MQPVSSPKIDKRIEIVGSSNPRLNAMAQDAHASVCATLSKSYTHVTMTLVDSMADLERLAARKPDLVVLGMKLVLLDPSMTYEDSPKVWLSDYLKERNINFTGSETQALALEFDKHRAKQRVIDAGLQSSAYFITKIGQPMHKPGLTFPLFVKPTNRGDSKGVDEHSVAHTDAELEAKILSIHNDLGSDALIEEYLPGREFSVAVIRRPYSSELLAMPVEIKVPIDKNGNSFLSESVKEADTEEVIPVEDNPDLKSSLSALAVGVFEALGSRDYGRIDMRLDALGNPSFIEANLMPGLSDHGYLTRCFSMNEHISYDDMIMSITNLGFERSSS